MVLSVSAENVSLAACRPAQAGHRGRVLGVTPVEAGQRALGELVDVRQDGFVECPAAEPFDALGQPEQLDAAAGAA